MSAPQDLFFSEYVEGASLNKALEIFNPTGAPIDLAAYSIQIFFNGSDNLGTTLTLKGTLAPGDVYVVADDGADQAILNVADLMPSATFFNGDDAILLLKDDVVIDSIGQRGEDPGSAYGAGDFSTKDNTLRRDGDIAAADDDPTDAFDPTEQWTGFGKNVFDGLGSYEGLSGGSEAAFTLQLFHLSDQEANTTSVQLAPALSAVYETLSIEDLDGDGVAGFEDTLFLSSGDVWIPGLFYDASAAIYGVEGAADILIQNELGVQAISFGNHEFDNGTGVIAELVSGDVDFGDDDPSDFVAFDGANFPYLAGNLDFSTDANLAPLAVADGQNVVDIAGKLSGSAVITTEGGETIGLVSAVTPAIDDGLTSPGGDLGVLPASNDLADLADLIQADVDALRAANPGLDKIILLSHQQVLSREVALAGLLEGVDVIVAGGSNSVLLDANDEGFAGEAADGVYPIFETAADGAPVAIVNTDAAYSYLGRLVIGFDETGEIIPESYDVEVSGAYATDQAGLERIGADDPALIDPDIQAIADGVEDTIVEGESNFFAVSDVFLNGERAGGGTDGVRTQETNLGNLTADANLAYAQSFDPSVVVSFKNGGGIRANIGRIFQPAGDADPERLPPEGVLGAKPEGGISENDVANALAFNNGLTLLSLTTAQLVETIEGTLENYSSLDESAGGFGQFGGLRFSFDPDRDPGSRVVNAAVVDEETDEIIAELVRDGEIVDNGDQTFRTVTLNFLANGGADGLPVTEPGDDGFDAEIAAATDRVELYKDEDGDLRVDEDAPATGAADFAPDGTEQDALAEYLLAEYGRDASDPDFRPVDLADTTPELDERIQNLDFREDGVFADDPAEGGFTLELLHLTDQEPLNVGGTFADIVNASAVLNALKAEDIGADGEDDATLVLSSGDAIIPGLFYAASEQVFGTAGVGDILIQNALGFQAMALGNHEFDFGTGDLAGLISGDVEFSIGADAQAIFDAAGVSFDSFDGTAYPYLSGNLGFGADENLAPLEAADGQAPQPSTVTGSTVLMAGGEKVGVVGATTPTLGSISSPGDVAISPSPFGANPTPEQLDALAAIIQADVDALLADNPHMNKVVLLSHMQQIAIEQALAERLTGVDVIVAGGSNTRLFDETDRVRDGDSDQGDYPIFVENAGGSQTAIVNTDGSYKYVGRLVIDFDEKGEVIPGSYDPAVSGAYATDAQGVADLGAEGLIDPEIEAIVEAISDALAAQEGNVFGVSEVFLNGNRSGDIAEADDLDGVRTQETNLGNLTADANLVVANEIAAAQGETAPVVFSLKNGGGIRASIGETVVPAGETEAVRQPNPAFFDGDGNLVKPAGGISQNDIATTLAFNNGLTLLTLTGAEIAALLEHGVSSLPGVAGSFPQIAGAKFSFDPEAESGSRLVNAGLFDEDGELVAELLRDGELVSPEAEYRVVTLSFLAAPRFNDAGEFTGGGDGYPFPNTNTDPEGVDGDGNPITLEVGDPEVIERVDVVQLAEGEGEERDGAATFAPDGSEQDALAEYLSENFDRAEGGSAFDVADTPRTEDERIQNLAFRADTVFDGFPAVTRISEIQGSGGESPLRGESVRVEAIVTAVLSNGFFMQEEDTDADGDAATSEGVFVFTRDAPTVAVGDLVRVDGVVDEFFGETQLEDATVETIATERTLPAAVALLIGAETTRDDYEAVEGMRVSATSATDDPLTITANFNFDRFGELQVSAGEKRQPTQQFEPGGEEALALIEANENNTLFIDDGSSAQNPDEFAYVPVPEAFDNGNGFLDAGDDFGDEDEGGATVRLGTEIVEPIVGVMDFSFGDYKVVPTEQLVFDESTNSGARPELEEVGGTLQIASLNVLNYFATLDQDGAGVGPNDLGPRGADNAEELERQTEKLVAQIEALDAEVLALQELGNDGFGEDGSIATLTAALNDAGGDYAFVSPLSGEEEFVGADAITTGIVYDMSALSLVYADMLVFEEASAAATFTTARDLDAYVSPNDRIGDFQRNRPAVAATFKDEDSGAYVSVVSVHFKSKGDSNLEDTFLDASGAGAPQALIDALLFDPNYDQGDGQGFWNQVRADASAELKAWLDGEYFDAVESEIGAGVDNGHFVLGDFNAYAKEDPTQVFGDDDNYVDLVDQFVEDGQDEAYTFVFDGQQGTLDQAFASESLSDNIADAFVWHVNADEPDLLNYDLSFKNSNFYAPNSFGASDHDPIIIGLDLEAEVEEPIVIVGDSDRDRLEGTEADEIFVFGAFRSERAEGGGGEDIYVLDPETFSDGSRGVVQILDWSDDDALDLGGAGVTNVRETSRAVYLTVGEDSDRLVIRGVDDIDEISILEELAIV